MEILTLVLKGTLAHRDSLGNTETLIPGRIQRMYAGSGVSHSEFNKSSSDPLHLIQIWIEPNIFNIDPEYEEKDFDLTKPFQVLASPEGEDGSIKIYQKVKVFLLMLKPEEEFSLDLESRPTYLHTIKGDLKINNQEIHYGDGVEILDTDKINFQSNTNSWVIGFQF